MATFRVGVGSFNIQDGAVGFGTDTDGLGNLRVKGVTKTTGSIVSGASTLTRYSGFAADNINQLENITLTSEVGTIGDIVVGVGTSVIISSASTVTVGTVESVSIGTHFSPPVGGIEERGDNFIEGMMRFNADLNTMEFYNGNEWRQFTYIADIQNSAGSSGRGLSAGSYPGEIQHIDFINISTKGNSVRFGDMTEHQGLMDAASSSTRMVTSGGYNSSFGGGAVQDIQYVTMASAGNTIDFGDQTQATYGTGASSSSTRALIMGGNRMPNSSPFDDGNDGNNTICTIEIATIGNAIDFGDLSARRGYPGACGDPVRMVIFGGYNNAVGSPLGLKTSDTVVYASHGNGVDFGEASHGGSNKAGSNSTKGIWAGTSGGSNTYTNIMYTVSIQSLGNATDFGDRTYDHIGSAMSSQTRLVMAGGKAAASPHATTNLMDFVEFASSGNAQDFGDLSFDQADAGGASDCHGGLGGY